MVHYYFLHAFKFQNLFMATSFSPRNWIQNLDFPSHFLTEPNWNVDRFPMISQKHSRTSPTENTTRHKLGILPCFTPISKHMKPRVLRCFNGFPENHGMFEIIMIYHDIWNPLKSPKAYPGENPPDIFMFSAIFSQKKIPWLSSGEAKNYGYPSSRQLGSQLELCIVISNQIDEHPTEIPGHIIEHSHGKWPIEIKLYRS